MTSCHQVRHQVIDICLSWIIKATKDYLKKYIVLANATFHEQIHFFVSTTTLYNPMENDHLFSTQFYQQHMLFQLFQFHGCQKSKPPIQSLLGARNVFCSLLHCHHINFLHVSSGYLILSWLLSSYCTCKGKIECTYHISLVVSYACVSSSSCSIVESHDSTTIPNIVSKVFSQPGWWDAMVEEMNVFYTLSHMKSSRFTCTIEGCKLVFTVKVIHDMMTLLPILWPKAMFKLMV